MPYAGTYCRKEHTVQYTIRIETGKALRSTTCEILQKMILIFTGAIH